MTAFDSTCSDVTELVTDYLEQALPLVEQTSFEVHLVYCSDCLTFLGQMRQTVAQLASIPADPVDLGERAELVNAFRRER